MALFIKSSRSSNPKLPFRTEAHSTMLMSSEQNAGVSKHTHKDKRVPEFRLYSFYTNLHLMPSAACLLVIVALWSLALCVQGSGMTNSMPAQLKSGVEGSSPLDTSFYGYAFYAYFYDGDDDVFEFVFDDREDADTDGDEDSSSIAAAKDGSSGGGKGSSPYYDTSF
jgi:hypothetical protein